MLAAFFLWWYRAAPLAQRGVYIRWTTQRSCDHSRRGVRLGRPISQKHKCQILGLVLHKDTSKFRFDQYAWQRTRVRAKRG